MNLDARGHDDFQPAIDPRRAPQAEAAPALTVLVPCFNEEGAIASTLEDLEQAFAKAGIPVRLLVIDDGSEDRSLEILENMEGVEILRHPYNLGYGAALKSGLKRAESEWIAITDADGTYPVDALPELFRQRADYDMVVGARIGAQAKVPWIRRPAKWILRLLAGFLTGRRIPDLNSGLRIFRRQRALDFLRLYPSGFSFTTTLTLAFLTNDHPVLYVPVDYFRRVGKSSIQPLRDFTGFLLLVFRVVLYFEPLRFFLAPGIALVLAGLGHGIYQVLTLPTGLGQFPLLAMMVGLQIVLLGFLADLIVKSR